LIGAISLMAQKPDMDLERFSPVLKAGD